MPRKAAAGANHTMARMGSREEDGCTKVVNLLKKQ